MFQKWGRFHIIYEKGEKEHKDRNAIDGHIREWDNVAELNQTKINSKRKLNWEGKSDIN